MNGWISISYNGDSLALTGSAFDADGGPMIVGGGSALTPEPSAALLLFVGGTLLVLRRRRNLRLDLSEQVWLLTNQRDGAKES